MELELRIGDKPMGEQAVASIRPLARFQHLDPWLQTLADRAEGLIQEIVNRAYQHPATPLDVIMAKDLGDQMIEIIDRCREAGGLISRTSFQFL
jgi:hypothetical protein